MDYPSAPREAAGWANYFRLGRASLAHAAADAHSSKRLRGWLCRKRKVKSGGRTLPCKQAVAGRRFGTPEGADSQLCGGESMISNESPVWKVRTLGSMSRERKRGQGGDRGTGTVAKAVGNCYSLHPRQVRLSSTLQFPRVSTPRWVWHPRPAHKATPSAAGMI